MIKHKFDLKTDLQAHLPCLLSCVAFDVVGGAASEPGRPRGTRGLPDPAESGAGRLGQASPAKRILMLIGI